MLFKKLFSIICSTALCQARNVLFAVEIENTLFYKIWLDFFARGLGIFGESWLEQHTPENGKCMRCDWNLLNVMIPCGSPIQLFKFIWFLWLNEEFVMSLVFWFHFIFAYFNLICGIYMMEMTGFSNSFCHYFGIFIYFRDNVSELCDRLNIDCEWTGHWTRATDFLIAVQWIVD